MPISTRHASFATDLRFLVFGALILTLVCACGGAPEATLHVTAHAPSGTVQDDRASFRIAFDQPAVTAEEVGKPLTTPPVKISPPLSVSAHWLDRQTLSMTPNAPLARATRYTVELTGELGARVGGSFSYAFVHAPLVVQGVVGVEPEWLPEEPTFSLVLNQPISAGRVAEHCTLDPKDGGEPARLTTADATLVSTRIPLSTRAKLPLGTAYDLRCMELVPEGGNAPMAEPFSTPLRVHPALVVTQISPTGGEKVTPDELALRITFSTPIPHEQLVKHVHLEPKHKSFRGGWVQRDSTTYELEANLEAETAYTLRVSAGLTDQFGQKLEKAQTAKFVTSDASPSLSVETGIYAVEAASEGYPVWSRNVDSYELSCAPVSEKRIVSLLTQGLDYNPWLSDGKSETLDFKALGLKQRSTVIRPASAKNKWSRSRIELGKECGGPKLGVYLAEIRSPKVEEKKKARGGGPYPYRLLANVTDLGVLLKVAPASGLVWVSSLSSAAAVSGAQVTVYDPRGKKVWSGQTDARGLVSLPGADVLLKGTSEVDGDPFHRNGWEETYRDQRVIAVVRKGDDVAVVDGNWSDGIQSWNFGVDTDHAGGQVRVRGFIESDRGIYRPGETVHLKGLVREVPQNGPARLPAAREVQVHVEDGQGAAVLDKRLTLSEFGGFDVDVSLDAGAPTGDYYVTAAIANQTFRESFSVEEVRAVTFEIKERTTPAHLRLGDKLKIPLEARYLFGAPVTQAKVSFEIQRRPRWVSFPEFENYSFVDWSELSDWSPWWLPDSYSDFVSEGESVTDREGRFQVLLNDPAKELRGPQDYLVRATVRDATDQEVSKRLLVTGHPSDFYLGVRTDSWVQTAKQPFTVSMVAVGQTGNQVGASATLSLSRERWVCSRQDGPYGYYSPCERHLDQEWSRPVKLGAAGASVETIEVGQPGEYTLRLVAKDARGVEVTTATSVWVVGAGESFWGNEQSAALSIIASKKRYDPGDIATLVPQADLTGATVLVTTERSGVMDARIESSDVGSAGIKIAISEAHAPNVYVSVATIKPRRGPKDDDRPTLRLGVVNLPVTFEQKRLKVEISTDRTDFEPGDEVTGKIRVLSREGTPVRAEVALSAADEGILQLIGYQTPDPMLAFYAPWGLGVDNASNWTRVARLDNTPADADGEEGADGAGGEDRVRSRFVASAYWAPSLVTDERGEVSFSFVAPDNLTAFRLMAAVADAGERFGSAEQRIRVRKDLLLAPILPRFLLENDEIELGAVVHNYTASAGEVDVRFDLDGVSPGKKTIKVKVEANGKATARFKAKVGGSLDATLRMSATLGTARDTMVQTLPILHPSVTDYATVLEGRSQAARADAVGWPAELDPSASGLEVLIDRVGLADLGPSLKYLIRYPYGCLEQTMSGLVPLLKVRDLAQSLDLPELEGPRLDTYVKSGVAKVIRHQQGDGQFSLWPGSTPYPHLTVYALWGLNEARRAGVSVPQSSFDRGLDAIRTWVNDPARTLAPGDETATLAMASFVMADLGAADPALVGRLFEARKALPAYGKAFLLRAMLKAPARSADVDVLARELLAQVDTKNGLASLSEPQKPDEHYFSSETRSMAMVISALLELGTERDTVDALVRGMRARRSGSQWQSTQDNVYGLVALADYARSEARGKAHVVVTSGERVLAERTLVGGAILRVRVPLRELVASAPLRVEASAPVFYNAVLQQVKPVPKATALARGFEVTREYLDLRADRSVTQVKVGDVLRVRIRLRTSEPMNYVAISDPLPSGFEAINGKLATERGSDAEPYWGFWNHRDLRDERADWFVDVLGEGDHTLEYSVRATHAGVFVVPPTHAEEMYTPSVMGHTATQVLTVTR